MVRRQDTIRILWYMDFCDQVGSIGRGECSGKLAISSYFRLLRCFLWLLIRLSLILWLRFREL